MPLYSIPCWIMMERNFNLVVEASSPVNAILEARKLVESSKEEDRDYVEQCIAEGCVTESGDGRVDFFNDPDTVIDISDSTEIPYPPLPGTELAKSMHDPDLD